MFPYLPPEIRDVNFPFISTSIYLYTQSKILIQFKGIIQNKPAFIFLRCQVPTKRSMSPSARGIQHFTK